MNKIRTHLIILLLITLAVASCNSSSEETVLDDQEGFVAQVGDFKISDQHFKNELIRFYNRTGQSINLNPEMFETIVHSRLDRYAMVEFARSKGWHETAEAHQEKVMIERKVNMEEFERRFIHDDVEVTENDLRTLFYRVNTSLKASHLFARNLDEANSLYERLQNGESFEGIAAEIFKNPELARNGGDLGYFTVDDMDVAFEDRAYQLDIGEVSQPVKTSRGYSIIKVTDIIETPVITETEFMNRRGELSQIAYDQKLELATRAHMQFVIQSLDINTDLMDELWDLVENSPDYSRDITETENILPGLDQADRDRAIYEHPNFTFTVRDFLQEARYTNPERRQAATEQWIFEEQLAGMAYRRYALGQVIAHPNYNEEYVERSIEETFYSYLISKFDSHVNGLVTVNENEIEQEFSINNEYYVNPLELNLAEIIITREDEAESAWARLQNGEPFKQILNEYTADRDAVKRDGELGFIPIDRFGMMAPTLRDVQPGDFAGPFQISSHRYLIFKVLDRKESTPITYTDAKESVKEFLHEEKKRTLKRELINEAKADFNAIVFTDRLNSLTIEL